MYDWYLVKAKFTKEFADGALKRVTESYLFRAANFTDAETRVHAEVGEGLKGEFLVKSITKQTYHDIFRYDDCDTWYRCTITHLDVDCDSGRENNIKVKCLVSADDVDMATDRINESFIAITNSFEILKVEKTGIVEIFELDDESLVETEIDGIKLVKMENLNIDESE